LGICQRPIASISLNTALFSLIGTQFGGNGQTTFALPDLRGRTLVGAGTNAAATYVIGEQAGTDTVTLSVANLPTQDQPVTCFAEGTCIATVSGPMAVEDLSAGDVVRTVDGCGQSTVRWIGHRAVDCARHKRPEQVWPIRVRAGAFGARQPQRDLLISPDHAVFMDGVLVPAKHLINGTSIAQVKMDRVTYYHVELSQHAILLAEGLPAESYLDTGDRTNFANGGGAVALHPDFASRIWEAEGCAPLVVTGAKLEAIRQRVNARARRAARTATAAAA
jgi:collagen type I alpha